MMSNGKLLVVPVSALDFCLVAALSELSGDST
jgi:hypothetical protein